MNGWQEIKLGDVATITAGGDAPKNAFSKTKTDEFAIPIYSNGITDKGLYGYTNKATIIKPATTISARGTIGAVFRRTEPYLPIVRLISVIGNEEIVDSDFLYYALCNQRIEGDGSVQAQLTVPMISNYYITIPSLQTQKRIARILSSLDDKIEVNDQINRNLEEQAKAIFKSWFVDFEPFGGEPPNEWKNISFSSFLKPRREKSSDPSIPLFAVTNNGIIPRDEKFKKNLSRTGAQNKVAYRTDMVFGMSREILNWGIMQEEKGCISSAYHVFAVSEDIDSMYLELYIKANIGYFKDLIRPAAREGQGLDQQALMSKEILLPPEDIISVYHKIADPIFVKIQQINTENQTLSTLRDTLLPKLISGEIEI